MLSREDENRVNVIISIVTPEVAIESDISDITPKSVLWLATKLKETNDALKEAEDMIEDLKKQRPKNA